MSAPRRINVTLDAHHAAKLSMLARRTNLHEGTLARALLAGALDEADPDVTSVVDLLARIPGASSRIAAGVEDAAAGRTVPLDDL